MLYSLMGWAMVNEIIPYFEMCRREGSSLQRGMNYLISPDHSVVLMSLRPNAPYADRLEEGGAVLIYEGHDVIRNSVAPDPKVVDQPDRRQSGGLTENGKFFRAAKQAADRSAAHRVRVYEKIRQGIWSYNGLFHLVDAWREHDGRRQVFKFKLVAVNDEGEAIREPTRLQRRRVIPTAVKVEVWKRDRGRCVICGATDELHLDHQIPFSKGGTSITADNVQLLCARHNLAKRDKIV